MPKKHKQNYIYIVGYTTNNEVVVGGLWKTYETYGLPLDVIFDVCIRRNWIPSWIDLYKDMIDSKMEHGRIISKLEEAINDSFGKDYCGAVISRLEKIFKPQENK